MAWRLAFWSLLLTTGAWASDPSTVLWVGNGADGTVSVVDPVSFTDRGEIDVLPDRAERLAEIQADPIHRVLYQVIRHAEVIKRFEPAGGDRFVDDMISSPDGTRLYVSRGILGDVAAFDLTAPRFPMLWRAPVELFKADHMALSPDGSRLAVSASLASKTFLLETERGAVVGSFRTGILPHQNDFSADGSRIYNGSLGAVNLPYALNGFKGKRQLTVVDAKSLKTIRTYEFPAGVRPTVLSRDEKTAYMQLSYLNGVVKFDMDFGKIVAMSVQPLSAFAASTYGSRDEYPHNSAHHGLALSGNGQTLCDAGTIDNTVSLLSADDLTVRAVLDVGLMPYWSTTSEDGRYCFVTLSGDNQISVIDYETAREVARVAVGKLPQRNRLGKVTESALAELALGGARLPR